MNSNYTKHFSKQPRPELNNAFKYDDVLQFYIKRFIPAEVLDEITPDLNRFGEKVVKEYIEYAEEAERYKPVLEQFDAWGK